MFNLKNKNVVVLGLGVSGKSALKLLLLLGAKAVGRNTTDADSDEVILNSDLVILSPGIPREAVSNKNIEIWGDGQARREFTYVGDVADFIVKNFASVKNWPRMMNIGFGTDHSIDDYYCAIGKELDFSGTFTHNLEKPVGMKQKC
jgi:nucleoside-diphosphate-sugar epimerase